MVATAVLAPLVSPHDPDKIDFTQRHLAPSLDHPFGTDDLGRDVFLRAMYGGRVTLAVGLFSVVLALLVGIIAGAVSGYFGGVLDLIVMRLTDMALSIPVFLIVLLLSSVLTPGLVTI
jgi:peptide/nickel transport system permease protein